MTIKRLLKDLDLHVRTTKPTAQIATAISELARDDTSALVVTDDNEGVLGILSSSDIVKYLNKNNDLSDQITVSSLMTNDVISCDAKENVRRLEQLMTEHQVRHIPITDEGVLCAVVNVLELVRYRMQSAEKEAGQLRDYVSGVV
jgi:CBS domain-containing protein